MGKGLIGLYKTLRPASDTEEGKARLDSYFLELGRFAHQFALTELAVHRVLAHYAKLPLAASRALLSGVRTDETRNRLSRLHEAKLIGDTDWNDLEPLFRQLAVINTCRNDIFHNGAAFVAEGRGIVTNAAMALTEERVTKFDISPEILGQMTKDLHQMLLHFHIKHLGRAPLRGEHPELEALLRSPWRYTPPPKPRGESRKSSR